MRNSQRPSARAGSLLLALFALGLSRQASTAVVVGSVVTDFRGWVQGQSWTATGAWTDSFVVVSVFVDADLSGPQFRRQTPRIEHRVARDHFFPHTAMVIPMVQLPVEGSWQVTAQHTVTYINATSSAYVSKSAAQVE